MGQGDVPWTILADPEGNEFCMARFWGEAMDWTLHEVTDEVSWTCLTDPEGYEFDVLTPR